MTDKTEKVMDRIRKLLAMASDTGSPHEAAIAARRARKLMDEYQISEMDLSTVDSSDMGSTDFGLGTKNASTFHGRLAVAVANVNDCQVGYARNRVTGKLDLRFNGMLVDTVCATELFKYLSAEAYKQAVKYETGRADRHAYRLGFASGVHTQVKDVMREREQLKTKATASHAGTALVACKQALVRDHFGAPSYRSSSTSFSGGRDSYGNGVAAGRRASLNRQVRGQQQGRLSH